jgi:hypothetical protein
MSKETRTTPTTFLGLFNDGYKADDGNGHVGYGNTPEEANQYLQRAQEKDLESSSHTFIPGWGDQPKR